jgi:GTPase involved in cell partitioning and DNA repair
VVSVITSDLVTFEKSLIIFFISSLLTKSVLFKTTSSLFFDDLKKSYKQIKNELKNYSSKISKKRELVVLNKTDLVNNDDIKKIIKDFSKVTKSEVITLTTFEKKGLFLKLKLN